ncbi:redoxin domain-containing protein [Portibacter marinus]|uniref:redoxin domain-containing protein n=1 Tax=Portibacter marinus TaxID=2898660 RepID=UPI001F23EBF2|nr:redoxin domain-containing protein [Portibacter marinus]
MKFSKYILLVCWLMFITSCMQTDVDTKTLDDGFQPNPQALPAQEVKTLELGQPAPDFRLPNHKGEYVQLADFDQSDVLAIIFTCNHCPTAQAYEDRMIDITDDYQSQSFQMVAITSNSPLGLLYNELGYSDLNDDFEAMKPRVDYKGYNFPYLYDGDDHEVSLQYGPVATPHAFVFNKERKLIYKGRIDGSEEPGTGNGEDLRNAIDSGLKGEKPSIAETKTFGCSTKWAWKTEYKEKDSLDWASRPVTLEMIDEKGIADLKVNDSGKLRLINVWATWCGPCIQEYPDFIVLQRMYGARDFEFISISADKPSAHEKALQFLKDKQSAVSNYLFDKDDKYALIEAIDPEWNGALPYTMLIDHNGAKIWSHQGTVDFLDLKRTIVEHELIGRYY